MSRKPTVADQALQLIEAHGPSTTSDLGRWLAASGATHARDPEATAKAAARGDRRFLEGDDGRFYSLFAQLEGAYLVHRLSDFEREHEMIVIGEGDWLLEFLFHAGIRNQTEVAGWMSLSSIDSVFDLPAQELDDDELWPDAQRSPQHGASAESTYNYLLANRWASVVVSMPGWLEPIGTCEYLSLKVCSGLLEIGGLRSEDFGGDWTANAAHYVKKLVGEAESDPSASSISRIMTVIATRAPELLRHPLPPFDQLVATVGLATVGGFVDVRARPLPAELLAGGVNDHYYDHMATTMTATNAKATLLALLDRVETGEEIEITRHGRTIARLVPATGSVGLRGSLAGVASTQASDEDLFSTGVAWDAA